MKSILMIKINNEKEAMVHIKTKKAVLDDMWNKLIQLNHTHPQLNSEELNISLTDIILDISKQLDTLENEIHRQDNKKK